MMWPSCVVLTARSLVQFIDDLFVLKWFLLSFLLWLRVSTVRSSSQFIERSFHFEMVSSLLFFFFFFFAVSALYVSSSLLSDHFLLKWFLLSFLLWLSVGTARSSSLLSDIFLSKCFFFAFCCG